jgi:hypothetical protein
MTESGTGYRQDIEKASTTLYEHAVRIVIPELPEPKTQTLEKKDAIAEEGKRQRIFEAASLCQMILYFKNTKISSADAQTEIRFTPGPQFESLFNTLMDQLPEEPIDYTKKPNGHDKEKNKEKLKLLKKFGHILESGNGAFSALASDDAADELMRRVYELNDRMFDGSLIQFLQTMVEQDIAYTSGAIDTRKTYWIAPRHVLEKLTAAPISA